jgi:hypothetical protein
MATALTETRTRRLAESMLKRAFKQGGTVEDGRELLRCAQARAGAFKTETTRAAWTRAINAVSAVVRGTADSLDDALTPRPA